VDSGFACAYNALGVALDRLGRTAEARSSFERAFELAPEWFLPPLQVAQQLIAAGQAAKAIPLLEKAVRFNPRAPLPRWALLRVLRSQKKDAQFLDQAAQISQLFPDYAPAYLEIAAFHDSRGEFDKAVSAYDAYLTLAPNFEDSSAVRTRLGVIRRVATEPAPSLRRAKPAR
jgi:tetratricopeptide (TPR) repeat protein